MAQSDDAVLAALDDLVAAIEENGRRNQRVLERAAYLRAERQKGRSYSELVSVEQRPLIVELIGENLRRLNEYGSRLRREEARALHDEGVTMEEIAALFGVTRQRVSALLKAAERGRSNGSATAAR